MPQGNEDIDYLYNLFTKRLDERILPALVDLNQLDLFYGKYLSISQTKEFYGESLLDQQLLLDSLGGLATILPTLDDKIVAGIRLAVTDLLVFASIVPIIYITKGNIHTKS